MPVRPLAPLEDADREVLQFLAAHRLALAEHVMVLLRGKNHELAKRRLRRLLAAELVRRERVMRSEPDCFLITPAGLDSIGSDLPPPEFDPRYRHDVGVAWLWLAARGGAFGSPNRIVTERELRSSDERRPPARDLLQYPDLLLIRGSRRVALLLQLTSPSPRRLEGLLGDFTANTRISAVLFLVAHPGIGSAIRSATTNLKASPVVHIQPVTFGPGT